MVRELKENVNFVNLTGNKEGEDFEAGLKSIGKKLDSLIPELGKVMVLVQNDNTDMNNSLMKVYASSRELLHWINLIMP